MDDIVLLARTRWQLRGAIAELQEVLTSLGLRTHREKRFIGSDTRGFEPPIRLNSSPTSANQLPMSPLRDIPYLFRRKEGV